MMSVLYYAMQFDDFVGDASKVSLCETMLP